jgi:hypothetical protein
MLKFPNQKSVEVCPSAYIKAHCRGHTYYDRLVREIKHGAVNGDASHFSRHYSMKPSAVKHIMKHNSFGVKLTVDQFTAANIPNTILTLHTSAWMKAFFALTGIFSVVYCILFYVILFIFCSVLCIL